MCLTSTLGELSDLAFSCCDLARLACRRHKVQYLLVALLCHGLAYGAILFSTHFLHCAEILPEWFAASALLQPT